MRWVSWWLGLSPIDEQADRLHAARKLEAQRQEMYMLDRQVEVIRRRLGEFPDSQIEASQSEGSAADDRYG